MRDSSLVVEDIDSVAKLHAMAPEWRRLADAHAGGFPFRTWEWHAAWWTHRRADRLHVRDELYVRAFRAPTGELVGVAPLILTSRPSFGLGVRVLDFFGADPNITELRGLVCDPAREAEVVDALLQALAARASEWDWFCWRGLRDGTAAAAQVLAHADVERTEHFPNYVLRLPGTWEEFRASRTRNIKESLRKCYNSLKRDGHTFEFRVAESPEDVAGALEGFFRLHAARARLDGTVPHPDVFGSSAARHFLRDVTDRLARRRMVRVFQFVIAGEIVAVRIGFAVGDTLYLYFSGFDKQWAPYSVMTTTVAEALKYAIDEKFRHVNLSNGTDVSKTRWSPEFVTYRNAVQQANSVRSRFAYRTYRNLQVGLQSPHVRRALQRVLGRRGEL